MNDIVKKKRPVSLVYFSGKNPEDITRQLDGVNSHLPYKVMGAYSLGGLHWLVLEMEVGKVIVNNKGDGR